MALPWRYLFIEILLDQLLANIGDQQSACCQNTQYQEASEQHDGCIVAGVAVILGDFCNGDAEGRRLGAFGHNNFRFLVAADRAAVVLYIALSGAGGLLRVGLLQIVAFSMDLLPTVFCRSDTTASPTVED